MMLINYIDNFSCEKKYVLGIFIKKGAPNNGIENYIRFVFVKNEIFV